MAYRRIRPKRGLESTRNTQTPVEGEITVTTDERRVFIGDGLTAGGNEVGYEPILNKGAANGYASLDGTGKVPLAQLPDGSLIEIYTAISEVAQLALTVQKGDICVRTDESKSYIAINSDNANMGDWQELEAPVQSVNGYTGVVTLTKSDVGLGNVTDDAQLKIASNLSDLADISTARTNLGLGDHVTHNYGTTAGSVAEGDHTHTLSDVTDSGNSAGLDVGTTVGTVAAGDHNHTLSDITDSGNSAGLDLGTTAGTVAEGDHDHSGLYEELSNKGIANGYASLDTDGKVPTSQMHSLVITDTYVVASEAAQVVLDVQAGDIAIRTDESKTYIATADDDGTMGIWQELATPIDSVLSVNGYTGVVTLTKSDVGLGNVTDDAQLKIASNLSDLADAVTARINLGLGNSAVLDTGTTAGTVATGDHNHTLADITDSGNVAGLDLGTTAGTVAEGDHTHSGLYEELSNKGVANGYASLDGSGLVPMSELPEDVKTDVFTAVSEVAQLSLTVQKGDIAVRTDEGKSYIAINSDNANMGDWQELEAPVQSVNGYTGVVTLTKSDLGLGNVTDDAQLKIASNLSDLNNVATARTNLGLGDHVTHNYGTTAGSVAEGDHVHTLADVTDSGNSAGLDVGTIAGTVAAGDHNHTLTDVTDSGNVAGLDLGTTAGTVAEGDHNHSGLYEELSNKGIANGYAELDATGKVPLAQLPDGSLVEIYTAVDIVAQLALTVQKGDICVRTDERKSYIALNSTNASINDWQELEAPVQSVNGYTGVVTIAQDDITGVKTTDNATFAGVTSTSDVDVTGNVTLTGTVDGRDIATDGSTLDTHVADAGKHREINDSASGTTDLWSASKIDSELALKEDAANKGIANGYASLGADGKVPTSQMPALVITDTHVVASEAQQVVLDVQAGDIAIRTDESKTYIAIADDDGTMGIWQELATPVDSVLSVNGYTGVVTLTKSDIGLGSVTNALQLVAANNLSDLADASTARTNLGLGNSAVLDTGTSAGTVATGDHNHDGYHEVVSNKDVANGYAGLDGDTLIQRSVMPLAVSGTTTEDFAEVGVTAGATYHTNTGATPTLTFDGDDGTQWGTIASDVWMGIKLPDPKAVTEIRVHSGNIGGHTGNMYIYATEDDSNMTGGYPSGTWVTLDQFSYVNNTEYIRPIADTTAYKCYRLRVQKITGGSSVGASTFELRAPVQGEQGAIPGNTALDANNFLRGDFTWQPVGDLYASNNLSDLADAATARTNLGLGNVADALQLIASNNLSDLADASIARTNLGLGNSSTRDVGTGASDVATGDHTHIMSNIVDAGDAAIKNVGTTAGTVAAGDHTHDSYHELLSNKGIANGYASLDATGVIPDSQLPELAKVDIYTAISEVAQLALTVQKGDVCVRTDERKSYIAINSDNANMGDWQELEAPVQSVAGQTGVVVLNKTDVGLTNVSNEAQLTIANNLSDLNDAPTARTNLGLGNSAVLDTGTSAGTVATGDHTHVDKEDVANKGVADGYASLDSNALVPNSQLPEDVFTRIHKVIDEVSQLSLTVQEGDICVRTDLNKSYVARNSNNSTIADWEEILAPNDVTSVAGKIGDVTLDKTDVGLTNVSNDAQLTIANNLSDLNNISTARINLGLGNASILDTGTIAGTVATGDHTHTMSDVTDAGNSATLDVGTGVGQVAAGDHTHTSTDVTDLGNSATRDVGTTALDVAAGIHNHTLSDITDSGNSAGLDVGTGAGDVAAGNHVHTLADVTDSGNVAGLDLGTTAGTVAEGDHNHDASYIAIADRGVADGVASLDTYGLVPTSQLPALSITDIYTASSEAAQLALTVQKGDVCVRIDESKSYIALNDVNAGMGDWQELQSPADSVISVNGLNGTVVLDKTDIGLSNVADALQLIAANNLSDLVNVATARTNLGLGNSAVLNTGTSAGTVATGDHSHTLTDVTDSGNSAGLDVGTIAGTVAAGDHNHTSTDVTDLGDSATKDVGTLASQVAAGDHTHTLTDVTDSGNVAGLNLGTSAGTVAEGNHTHLAADVTDLGDSATKNVGTSAGTIAAGDHSHHIESVLSESAGTITFIGDMVPDLDNSRDIGSLSKAIRNIYADSTIYVGDSVEINETSIQISSLAAPTAANQQPEFTGSMLTLEDFTYNPGGGDVTLNPSIYSSAPVTFDGSFTFNDVVTGVTPTANNHLATKQYVDNNATTMTVTPSTTSITLTANDCRGFTVFTNEGATSAVEFTLPTAVAGYKVTFVVQDNDGIILTAGAGDSIRIGSTVSAYGGSISSTVIGDTATLVAINSSEWIVLGGSIIGWA